MVLARATQSVITFADAIQVKHLGVKAIAATATGGLNVMGLVILALGTVFEANSCTMRYSAVRVLSSSRSRQLSTSAMRISQINPASSTRLRIVPSRRRSGV